ncbi:hypothetical protein M378DRAFT_904215 [Amanita muscaria Koide BX008]|uniref:Uncharacterized protein n=1 Tax=Amanita muscaria (strain Koide BX008) TaxID=946122 RepID=A0A0C2RV57_AMAMK|nr:hypothetical protein M378DRAFT_904215 [Amanita muscaria Koide BX008]
MEENKCIMYVCLQGLNKEGDVMRERNQREVVLDRGKPPPFFSYPHPYPQKPLPS